MTSINSETCECGSAICDNTAGLYCNSISNLCATIPVCSNTDKTAANNEECSCGSATCDATAGLFCTAS